MANEQGVDEFHRWYYEQRLWDRIEFLGLKSLKCVFDLWNYQEIISSMKPDLVVETGAFVGGSTLFFSIILAEVNPTGCVITIDTKPERIDPKVIARSNVEVISGSSTDLSTIEKLMERRAEFLGSAFVILDSKPRMQHVLEEMINLRKFLRQGDYLVVEDTNVNGHPVLQDWGPGPMEALDEYSRLYPNDFYHDQERANKFGVTFAPHGFLRRI